MILPTKHIATRSSLLGLGAEVLRTVQRPMSVTGLWERLTKVPEVATFERFVLVLDLLYLVGAIEMRRGLIVRVK
jgi:hypothetical protein